MAFTVRDLEDLIRLLDKHPAWMEALRQRMLTKDLLESPKTLKRLSTRVGKVEKALQTLTESVAALTEAQRRHYEEFAAHRQEFLAYRAETEQRFAELREEVAAARAEADRRFAELAEAQRRHYEEFVAYRAETDRRFAALAEAQRRTEERVSRLEEAVTALAVAQRRTEERVSRLEEAVTALAEAQRRHYEEFAAFRAETEQRFAALIEAQRRTEEEVRWLAEEVRGLKEWVDDLDSQVRGFTHEAHYRTYLRRYYGLVRDPHVLSPEERVTFLVAAEAAGRLSAEEASDLEEADVIVRGRPLQEEGEVYLVVEVSAKVHPKDVERAARRARALRKALPDVEVLAVVAGPEIRPDAAQAARTQGVWWLRGSRPFAPEEIPSAPPSR
ncbi:MAG TPA: hypothetical protein VNK89_00190 [Thermoflexus sp.]|nr:hypothetical protein [Thermoflexus sp.]